MSNSADHARFIPQFDVHVIEGINQRWTRWCRSLDRLMAINGVKEDSMRQNYLFFCAGDDVEDVYTQNGNAADTYGDIIEKLTRVFNQSVQQDKGEHQIITQTQFERVGESARRVEENIEVFSLNGAFQEVNENYKEHESRRLMHDLKAEHDNLSDASRATVRLQTKEIKVYDKPFRESERKPYTHGKCTNFETRNKHKAGTERA